MKTSSQSALKLTTPEYKAKADLVYQEIRRGIMEGIFKPGDKLLTDDLAAVLRVSRMPVREAIKRLQIEGFVDVIPHKGATVATVTLEQLQDVFDVRAVLEGLAAREAAHRATCEDIVTLESYYSELEQMVAEGDTDGQLTKNREFHETIYRIGGNKVLQPLCLNLADSIERYRLQFMTLPRSPEDVLHHHREIIDAIARGDADAAERAGRRHIESTGRLMAGYVGLGSNGEDGEEETIAVTP